MKLKRIQNKHGITYRIKASEVKKLRRKNRKVFESRRYKINGVIDTCCNRNTQMKTSEN